MSTRLLRATAVVLTLAMSSGCILSRAVDRAFIGITVRKPVFADRKTTGIFLLPFSFVLDVATLPLQALLVVILGDNFPFPTQSQTDAMMSSSPDFLKLSEERQALARAELTRLLREGRLTPDVAAVLGEDGHWTLISLDAEQRNQLLARATVTGAPRGELVCQR